MTDADVSRLLTTNADRYMNLVFARLIASGDITLAATTVTARSLNLNAADGRGNVNLPVQQSTLDSSHTSRGGSTFWESASGSGVHSETAKYNQFNLGDASQVNRAVGQAPMRRRITI